MNQAPRYLVCSASDTEGGASKAAFRQYAELRRMAAPVGMLVQTKRGSDHQVEVDCGKWSPTVTQARRYFDRFPTRGGAGALMSSARYPGAFGFARRVAAAAVVHLHWTNAGFLSLAQIAAVRRPVVWTLHDQWPMTGGCHYASGCTAFTVGCGACPQLSRPATNDVSARLLARKLRKFADLDLVLVTPSAWMARQARQSSLFRDRRIEVIPNGLDGEVFKPLDQVFCRHALGLPQGVPLVLFGATDIADERKGGRYLYEALARLDHLGAGEKIGLVTFGGAVGVEHRDGLCIHGLGQLFDEVTLAMAYNAVDLFVAPSLEDNLPNTLIEAMACGTASAAFAVGGIPEIIDGPKVGLTAPSRDAAALADAMSAVLSERGHPGRRKGIREVFEARYQVNHCATRLLGLYRELEDASGGKSSPSQVGGT